MRILIATGIFPPQIGGPATYSKLLYDELPKHGIEVDIANFGDYIEKRKLIRHVTYFFDVLKKARKADLVLALDPVSVGVPALFASQIRGKKLVVKVVGDYAWEQGTQRFGVKDNLDEFARARSRYSWQVRVLKWAQKYVADGAARVIVPSKYLKSILVDWGIDARKVSVIYNGFHIQPVKETPSALRKRLKMDGKIITTVGRLVPWKGIKEVVGVMPDVIAAHPDAKLVIVGDGPEKENLQKQISDLNLGDAVTMMGRLEQAKMFEVVKLSDLFVLNTEYEGFSHQIIETMALGTPIITTAVGGNVEAIRNGENGILVAPGASQSLKEAIIGLLADQSRAEALAKVARKDVSRFTDEIMLQTLADELKAFVRHG